MCVCVCTRKEGELAGGLKKSPFKKKNVAGLEILLKNQKYISCFYYLLFIAFHFSIPYHFINKLLQFEIIGEETHY